MTDLNVDDLRSEFVRMLTVDGSLDRRRRDFNQAIFNAEEGWAIWSSTDLDMVMTAFDRAVRNLTRKPR